MSLKLTLSNIDDSDATESIKSAINTVDPTLKVQVDVESKIVTVNAEDENTPVASESSIRQAVTAAGYSIQN
jgi:copper chaperone